VRLSLDENKREIALYCVWAAATIEWPTPTLHSGYFRLIGFSGTEAIADIPTESLKKRIEKFPTKLPATMHQSSARRITESPKAQIDALSGEAARQKARLDSQSGKAAAKLAELQRAADKADKLAKGYEAKLDA